MKFNVLNRFSGEVSFVAEIECSEDTLTSVKLGLAVKWAIANDANLSSANLSSANLRYANLSYADLRYADLRYADLSSADLRYANLRYADLRYANLSSANLSSADLRYADLSSANLRSANLSSANLSSADLRYADLRYADLTEIKKDFFERLTLAKKEVLGLYDYLMRGLVDGSSYQGECACFCGTIAKVRKEDYEEMTNGLKPDSESPTERWFFGINKGDTEVNNQVSRITCEWVREFMTENGITIPQYKLVSDTEFPTAFAA